MVKIFFACSMSGGYQIVSRDKLVKIINILEELDLEVLSKNHLLKEESKDLTKTQIHDREFERMKLSQFGIFEVSNPSSGIGIQISDIVSLNKPVICFYKEDLHNIISPHILGKENSKYLKTIFEVYPYKDLEDIKKKVKDFYLKHNILNFNEKIKMSNS